MRNAAWLFTFLMLSGLASSRTEGAASPAQATGVTINGNVIQKDTGEAVRGAQITLVRSDPPERRVNDDGTISESSHRNEMLTWTSSTDGEGHFLFENVAPGEYRLRAAAKGYIQREFGSAPEFPSGGGTLVQVASNSVSGLVFRLDLSGVVSGSVYSMQGMPLKNIVVRLVRPSFDAQGKRSDFVAASTGTNERGEYRLSIVAPGRYYLTASDDLLRMALPSAVELPRRYATVYFPAATNLADASPVEMTPGREITGMDFSLVASPTTRVFGSVVDAATGRPPEKTRRVRNNNDEESMRPDVRVWIFSRATEFNDGLASVTHPDNTALFYSSQSFAVSPEGTFELANILPGRYWLLALENESSDSRTELSALVPLDLSAGTPSNIQMRLSPGATVIGRIEMEKIAGKVDPIPHRYNIRLTPLFRGPGIRYYEVSDASGSVTFNNVIPGEYRIEVANLPAGTYVRGGLTENLQLTAQTQGSIHIVLSQRVGRVDGGVSNKQGGTAVGARVVLVPDRLPNRTDLYRETISDGRSHYRFRQVVPGDYTIFAWTDLEGYPYFDADFIRKFEAAGKAVRITEGSVAEVDVIAIQN